MPSATSVAQGRRAPVAPREFSHGQAENSPTAPLSLRRPSIRNPVQRSWPAWPAPCRFAPRFPSLRVKSRPTSHGQGPFHEHTWPTKMIGRFVEGLGLFVRRQDFPHGYTMASQVRLTARKRVREGDAGELCLEALLDDVSRDEIALRGGRRIKASPGLTSECPASLELEAKAVEAVRTGPVEAAAVTKTVSRRVLSASRADRSR